MTAFVGPHTAETQQDADMYEQIAAQASAEQSRVIVPQHVVARRVADAVLEPDDDPRRWALVHDACGRDARWDTYSTLTESGRWVQCDDGTYVEIVVGS